MPGRCVGQLCVTGLWDGTREDTALRGHRDLLQTIELMYRVPAG
jgi:hypothetical protein